MEAHPGAMVAHPGTMEAHHGAMEAHSGAMKAHPGGLCGKKSPPAYMYCIVPVRSQCAGYTFAKKKI